MNTISKQYHLSLNNQRNCTSIIHQQDQLSMRLFISVSMISFLKKYKDYLVTDY